ncbi:hypothetical protein SAMN04487895_101628 [Paenibacillus sophorae]|uniref:Uncharacterized protein n=1 Tax=Paenibacillus sophorae TaxID=1333845 RepID=A0A1H8GSX0_9BACL|nr:hypothetical protein [Paenibacillus sophorae]QWU14326.1 hypothetical protein KP014_20685 [Paenibacillus sophorae]SEN46899.1 hypothetical protein SAMN04487895_101628 [Paenibacillus sophorae]
MNRLNTIKYIAETPIEKILNDIKQNKWDVNNIIAASLDSRKEYGLKVQQLVDELRKTK